MGLLNSVRQGVWSWLSAGKGGYIGNVTPYFHSVAGETVTPDSAMSASAYYACLRNISEDLSSKPIDVIKKENGTRESQDDHRVEYLMNVEWNPDMGSMSARELLQHWAMGWGNGYAEIERDANDIAVWLWPIHPSRGGLGRDERGSLVLRITEESGRPRDIPYANVFHIHGFGGDGLQGYSIAAVGCEAIGKALAQQKFGAAFFGNGATFGNVFEYPGKLDPQARENLKTSVSEQHAGAGKAFRGYVLESGGKLSNSRMGIPPEEAQLIESMQFSVEELARWFRCPPHIIGHLARAQGWSTLEMQSTEYVTYVQMNWAVRWEQEIRRKLFRASETNLQAKHNFGALLRGDSNGRADFYGKMFKTGIFSRNQIRELEDMNPVPGGDIYYIEGNNLQPLGDDGMPIVRETMESTGPEVRPGLINATVADDVDGNVIDSTGDAIGGWVADPAESRQLSEVPPTIVVSKPIEPQPNGPAVMLHAIIEDACNRVAAHDGRRIRKLVKTSDADTIGDFYAKHFDYLSRALAPAAMAWKDATGKDVVWSCAISVARDRESQAIHGQADDDYADRLTEAAMKDLTNA